MQRVFWASAAVFVLVTVLGLIENGGNKFVRIRRGAGCLASYVNVKNLDEVVEICCAGASDDHGVCPRGISPLIGKLLTSYWAFVIPLLGLVANIFCRRVAGGGSTAFNLEHQRRFVLYVGIILARTLVLYIAFNFVENAVQAAETSDCWYASLRRSGTCSERFDFADHVVLVACQYYAIQVSEIYCILMENQDSVAVRDASMSTRRRGASEPQYSWWRWVIPTVVCLVVAYQSLLLMYNTVAYFHTRWEILPALVVSCVFVRHYLDILLGTGGFFDSIDTATPAVSCKSRLSAPLPAS